MMMGRDLRIDFLRSIAILFMVEVHIAATIAPENIAHNSPLAILSSSIGGLAAPLFVMIAGWGASKSSSANIWLRFSFLMVGQLIVNLIASHVFNWYTPGILSLLALCGLLTPVLGRINNMNLNISYVFLLLIPFFMYPIDGSWFAVITAASLFEWLGLLFFDGTYPLMPWLAFYVLGFIVEKNQQKNILYSTLFVSVLIAIYALMNQIDWALTSGDAMLTFFPANTNFLVNASFGILLLYLLLKKVGESFFSLGINLSFIKIGKLSLSIYILHFIPLRYLASIDYHGSSVPITFGLIISYCGIWWLFAHLQNKYFKSFCAENLLRYLSEKKTVI